MSRGKAKTVALVVQRFGPTVVGGAESHARQIAQKLAVDLGWSVEVFTTAAESYLTWSNKFPVGTCRDGLLTVHRFPTVFPRVPRLFSLIHAVTLRLLRRLGDRSGLRQFVEAIWYRFQGPYCPALLKNLQQNMSRFDGVIFFTYLYYPTACGLPTLARRSVLVPTAHDEPPLYFATSKRLFHSAHHIIANTDAEKDLLVTSQSLDPTRLSIAGLGFDESLTEEATTTQTLDLPDRYVLFLGRVGRGKRVDWLIDSFMASGDKLVDGLTLVLAGEVEPGFKLPDHPRVRSLGFVAERDKRELLTRASAIVNPSPLESLSMIVLEAVVVGRPVIVNGEGAVLAHYAACLPSVFAYLDHATFAQAIGKALDLERKDLERSKEWVCERYSWARVLSEYERVFEGFSGD